MEQVAHLDEEGLKRFADTPQAKALRERVARLQGRSRHPTPAEYSRRKCGPINGTASTSCVT